MEFACAALIFQIVNGLAPPYISSPFTHAKSVHSHNTRFVVNKSLQNSRQHHKLFSNYGRKIWNSLPVDIRESKTVVKMKCKEQLISFKSDEILNADGRLSNEVNKEF